ncbi:hypothetical protein ACFO1V_05085 [Daeguia caeni]|uniref:HTH araC/xylS-type domain-containing protein n=2 Tax=Daeguia caeni TaxID=439612 RepID=A0ABV9H2S3_9HYPH
MTGFARRQDEKAAINSSSVVGKISLTSQMARQMQNLIACSGLTSYVFVRVLTGRISGKLSGRPLNVEAGSVLVFDCSRVSQADVEVECELHLAIPKLDISYPLLSRLHGFVLKPDAESEIIFMLLDKLERDFPTISRVHMRDMKYAFTGAFISQLDHRLSELGQNRYTLVDTICDYINRHSNNPRLTVEHVMEQFNISRSHLYRLFSNRGGVKTYILNCRLENLYNDALNHHLHSRNLKQMAHYYGFDNPQVMKNMFVKKYGFDPRAGVPDGPRRFETRT